MYQKHYVWMTVCTMQTKGAMSTMNRHIVKLGFVVASLMLIVYAQPMTTAQSDFELPALPTGVGEETGHDERYVINLLDEADSLITQAAIAIGVGDTYIGPDNTLYEVTQVQDDTEIGRAHV